METERILVIKLGAFGDFLAASGAMAAIRAHHPNAHIVLLTRKPFAGLGEKCPFVDEVWIDTAPKFWNVSGWLGLRRRLRGGHFSRVYDLQTSDRTGFYYRLLGPGLRPPWSGIAKGCSHPHKNPNRNFMHAYESRVEQLRDAGIAKVPAADLSWLAADIAGLGIEGDYALLVPGSSAPNPARRWPPGCFAALGVKLLEQGITPVLIGTAMDRAVLDLVLSDLPGAVDLCGRTDVPMLASLTRGAKAVVGGDTVPMHLAAIVGAPSVVLYSHVSNPALTAPKGERVAILRRPSLDQLGVDEVWTQIEEML